MTCVFSFFFFVRERLGDHLRTQVTNLVVLYMVLSSVWGRALGQDGNMLGEPHRTRFVTKVDKHPCCTGYPGPGVRH